MFGFRSFSPWREFCLSGIKPSGRGSMRSPVLGPAGPFLMTRPFSPQPVNENTTNNIAMAPKSFDLIFIEEFPCLMFKICPNLPQNSCESQKKIITIDKLVTFLEYDYVSF